MATQLSEEFEETGEELDEGVGGIVQTEGDPEPSEEQARKFGWKPKDEYEGDASKWRDWQDFLDDEKSSAPTLRATVKLLKRRLDQADKRYKNVEKTLVEFKEYSTKAEQRAYDRALAEIKSKQRAAVALADEDAFEAAEDELKELEKDAKAHKPAEKTEIDTENEKTFKKWERDNDWYNSDDAMTAVADKIAQKMGPYRETGMEWDEYLEELTARVKKEFPHKFELPKKRSAVEGVGETRPTKGQKSFDGLPREAQVQCDRFIAQGLIKDRAEYVKNFDWK